MDPSCSFPDVWYACYGLLLISPGFLLRKSRLPWFPKSLCFCYCFSSCSSSLPLLLFLSFLPSTVYVLARECELFLFNFRLYFFPLTHHFFFFFFFFFFFCTLLLPFLAKVSLFTHSAQTRRRLIFLQFFHFLSPIIIIIVGSRVTLANKFLIPQSIDVHHDDIFGSPQSHCLAGGVCRSAFAPEPVQGSFDYWSFPHAPTPRRGSGAAAFYPSYSTFQGIAWPVLVFLAGSLMFFVAHWSPHLEILQYRFSLWISTIKRHPLLYST